MTLGPGDLRDQSEVADKGEMEWSLLSLNVSVSRYLRSLGVCGLSVSQSLSLSVSVVSVVSVVSIPKIKKAPGRSRALSAP